MATVERLPIGVQRIKNPSVRGEGGPPLLLLGFGKLGGFLHTWEAPQNVAFCSANPRYNHYYGIAIDSGRHSAFVIGKFSFLILLGGSFSASFAVLLQAKIQCSTFDQM